MEIFVEGGLGAPLASVNTREMMVVEGHTVTMSCQASGKFRSVCGLKKQQPSLLLHSFLHHHRLLLLLLPHLLLLLLHVRQPTPRDHLDQTAGSASVEAHSGQRRADSD